MSGKAQKTIWLTIEPRSRHKEQLRQKFSGTFQHALRHGGAFDVDEKTPMILAHETLDDVILPEIAITGHREIHGF